jgi:LysM repeat protein
MTFWAVFFRSALVLLTWAFLCGCTPSGTGPQDEEKEPHFLAGKNRISTLDYKGAVDCFEKALQVNRKSASAHFELACLFDQKDVDAASAIYHYQHYLELAPKAGNADLVRQHIMACKQALAKTVSLGPLTEKMQHQLDQVIDDNKRLTQENKRLTEEVERWSSYAARLQTLTNYTATQPAPPPRVAQPNPILQSSTALLASSSPGSATATPTSSTGSRTHTVKSGETPSSIAKSYGVKLAALMAANPSVDPRRLRVGQVLRIPGS